MTVTDRTDATEQEFRDRIAAFESAPTPPEVREAAVIEEVARAIYHEGAWCGDCSYDGWESCSHCRRTVLGYARAAVAAVDANP